jgi:hypothetical protein
LTVPQILQWADSHHARTGKWPNSASGRIPEAPEETWASVSAALTRGRRGLPGGSSLAQLLGAERGKQTESLRARLTVAQVLAWADAHHQRTGRWPTAAAGPVLDAPGERWAGINQALSRGHRGLPGDSSLSWLLTEHGRGR